MDRIHRGFQMPDTVDSISNPFGSCQPPWRSGLRPSCLRVGAVLALLSWWARDITGKPKGAPQLRSAQATLAVASAAIVTCRSASRSLHSHTVMPVGAGDAVLPRCGKSLSMGALLAGVTGGKFPILVKADNAVRNLHTGTCGKWSSPGRSRVRQTQS